MHTTELIDWRPVFTLNFFHALIKKKASSMQVEHRRYTHTTNNTEEALFFMEDDTDRPAARLATMLHHHVHGFALMALPSRPRTPQTRRSPPNDVRTVEPSTCRHKSISASGEIPDTYRIPQFFSYSFYLYPFIRLCAMRLSEFQSPILKPIFTLKVAPQISSSFAGTAVTLFLGFS